jgi:hypothetical protein
MNCCVFLTFHKKSLEPLELGPSGICCMFVELFRVRPALPSPATADLGRTGRRGRTRAVGGFNVMNISRSERIRLIGLLLLLVAFGAFGRWFAPELGHAGSRFYQFLTRPLLTMGGLPITTFLLMKAATFVVALLLACHFTMIVLQNRILTFTPLEEGQRYRSQRVSPETLACVLAVFRCGIRRSHGETSKNLNKTATPRGRISALLRRTW